MRADAGDRADESKPDLRGNDARGVDRDQPETRGAASGVSASGVSGGRTLGTMSSHERLEGVTEADLPAVTRLITHASGGTAEGVVDWLKFAGQGHLRVLRAGRDGQASAEATVGGPPACLLRIPMSQYFG